jgi:hypothetical protein
MSAAEQHDWLRSATSRRSLLRAGAIGAGAAIAAPALLAGTAEASARRGTAAKATPHLVTRADGPRGSAIAPFGRHIAYGADPATQMAVAWQVAASVNNPFIRIGSSPLDLGGPIPAEVRTVTTPASIWNTANASPDDSIPPSLANATIEQYYLHATLTGLRPGQTYYYSVGHQGWDFSGSVATLGSFTTAPTGRVPFRFTAFGDMGWSYDSVGTATQVRTQNPAFHLHAGDISYAENGGDGLLTDQYDPRVWDNWFNLVEPAAGSLPWQIAVGNHEMEVWYSPDTYGAQYSRWDFPGSVTSSTPPTYYSWIYGNVGFVSLDANDVSYEIPANLGYSGGAQVAWLTATLAALRANPQVDFIVAYFHHCAYCTCSTHGSDGGVDKFFTNLFDQFTVDLVINGHNHIYERTDPIINKSSTQEAPIGTVLNNSGSSPAGTTYITAGGAGKSLYSFDGNSVSPGLVPDSYLGNINNDSAVPTYINSDPSGGITNDTVNWSRVRYTGYCLLVVDSEPGFGSGNSKLKITGLSEAGVVLDYLEIAR